MAHIHIALVGGQVYPVYLAIADLKPDGIILVHSKGTLHEAKTIQSEVKNVPMTFLELDPVDITQVFAQVKALYERLDAGDTYSVNLSGGTKIWSLAFYEYFRETPNVKLLYIDQNNLLYNLVDQSNSRSEVVVDMDQVFRLNGVQETTYDRLEEYTDEDVECANQLQQLRASYPAELRSLSVLLTKAQFEEIQTRSSGEISLGTNSLCWDKEESTIEVTMGIGSRKTIRSFSSPHVFRLFFHTGWFELIVAKMLSQWKYAKEVRMGVKFPYRQDGNPKNEIDIIVNTGNRLLFVECKTQVANITDIDKFRTAVNNFGGMGSKALFITLDFMKSTAAEKCKDSGVIPFSLKQKGNVQEKLYTELEKELFEINKR